MTIHNILEKVDLFNFMFDDDESSEDQKEEGVNQDSGKIVIRSKTADPQSAYLGPKLWNNAITLNDLMDEDSTGEGVFFDNQNSPMVMGSPETTPSSPESSVDIKPDIRTSTIVPIKNENVKVEPFDGASGSNEFLYKESKRARLDREKWERKRKLKIQQDFAPEDIALATVPGLDFDPKTRTFDMEELRPQPIIKKRKKNAVPEEMKDDKYWENRLKNKEATRRSREAKRVKENQIILRAAYLEKENKVLKQELETSNFENRKLETERNILKMKLNKYER